MTPDDPIDPLTLARFLFDRAPFMDRLGAQVTAASPGEVTAELRLQSWMTQATGVAHAGIVTALADHAAACAARTASEGDETFVSIQVQTSLVRPAAGPLLRAVGRAVKNGQRVSFASAEVFSGTDEAMKLCATFTVSLITAPPLPVDP